MLTATEHALWLTCANEFRQIPERLSCVNRKLEHLDKLDSANEVWEHIDKLACLLVRTEVRKRVDKLSTARELNELTFANEIQNKASETEQSDGLTFRQLENVDQKRAIFVNV